MTQLIVCKDIKCFYDYISMFKKLEEWFNIVLAWKLEIDENTLNNINITLGIAEEHVAI